MENVSWKIRPPKIHRSASNIDIVVSSTFLFRRGSAEVDRAVVLLAVVDGSVIRIFLSFTDLPHVIKALRIFLAQIIILVLVVVSRFRDHNVVVGIRLLWIKMLGL